MSHIVESRASQPGGGADASQLRRRLSGSIGDPGREDERVLLPVFPDRGLVGHVPIVATLLIVQGFLEILLGLLLLGVGAMFQWSGDKELESEGKVDKAKGDLHNAAGNVKDAARDLSKK